MYNAQSLSIKIKGEAKKKNILIRDMLSECDLSVNALTQMTDKKGISSFSLAKIADYLQCSVDYLLGRDNYVNYISQEELQVITAYINQPEMQGAVKKLLGIEKIRNNSPVLSEYSEIAAYGGKGTRPAKKKPEIT